MQKIYDAYNQKSSARNKSANGAETDKLQMDEIKTDSRIEV